VVEELRDAVGPGAIGRRGICLHNFHGISAVFAFKEDFSELRGDPSQSIFVIIKSGDLVPIYSPPPAVV